jgi:hypothetical protein
MKTVFFGPFIGELGWELLSWQGWVRRVSQGEFKGHRKIASSFPGRHPFYPYADEFWPLPEWFSALGISGHGYHTDGWRGGYPGKQVPGFTLRSLLWQLRRLEWPHPVRVEKRLNVPDREASAEAMLIEFEQRLPDDTVYFVPWKLNRYEPDGIEFGLDFPRGMRVASGARVFRRIDFRYQLLEYLEPTPAGEQALRTIVPDGRTLIALFPRCRTIRRADKNWPRGKYVELVRRLQRSSPDCLVTIFGEPGGTYFADGVPSGCLDLINVPPDQRLDLQLAALKRSVMGLGSMSGALSMAMAAGCPVLIWGHGEDQILFHLTNYMGTPMIYHADMDPSVDTVLEFWQALGMMVQGWPGRLNGLSNERAAVTACQVAGRVAGILQ